MAVFATAADYEERYGATDDAAVLAMRLDDASGLMEAAWLEATGGEYRQGESPIFDRNAKAVCCAVVSRATSAPPALAGVSQYSQGAGSYTASASFANPTGDMYLTRGDRMALGLGGSQCWGMNARTALDEGGD